MNRGEERIKLEERVGEAIIRLVGERIGEDIIRRVERVEESVYKNTRVRGEIINRLVGERRGEDIVRRKERVEERVGESVYKS